MTDWPLAPDAGEGEYMSPRDWLITFRDFVGICSFAGVLLAWAWVVA